MTQARQNACLALFVLLSIGVLVNVLVLQPRTLSSARSMSLGKTAGGSLPSAHPSPRLTFPVPDATSKEIAAELHRLGYLPASRGPGDVVFHAAVMQFQADAKLPVTGATDAALLATLILRSRRPPATRPIPQDIAEGSPAETVIILLQRGLGKRGYVINTPEGRLTEEVLRAIREYQMDKSVQPAGAVSAELLLLLQDGAGRG